MSTAETTEFLHELDRTLWLPSSSPMACPPASPAKAMSAVADENKLQTLLQAA